MCPSHKIIRDEYEIIEDLGQGGMAQVFKARQVSLGRTVAIKEIKPAFAAHPELVERFRREARTAAGLVHENIVQVYNFCEPGKGSLFFVMEYVEGHDLRTLLKKSGTIPPRVAAIIGREVARALAYAHARGLVHRDVKPGNVMVSSQGEIKLMDFGIVREMDSDLTKTGAFLGTPNYMSPEQFLGEVITPASDIFSLGVVLYEIMSGTKPFKAEGEDSLSKQVRTAKEVKLRTLNPKVPWRLAGIVHKCLQKAPHKRYPSAEHLAGELERFLKTRNREAERKELTLWGPLEAESTDVTVDVPVKKAVIARKPEKGDTKTAAPPAAGRPEIVLPEEESDKEISVQEEKGVLAVSAGKNGDAEAADQPTTEIPIRPRAAARAGKAEKTADLDGPRRRSIKAIESKTAEVDQVEEPRKGDEQALEAGAALVKWLWRAILFAIALLAAVIMFMIFDPGPDPDSGLEPTVAQKIIYWIKDVF